MATKTLILRPTGWITPAGGADTCVPHPTNTADENKYLLVAEETPDGDASYLYFSNNLNISGVTFSCSMDITPLDIRIVCCARSPAETGTLICHYYINSEGGYKHTSLDTHTLTETYSLYNSSIPSKDVISFWNKIMEESKNHPDLYLVGGITTTGKGAVTDSRFTQLYLEVDYDSPSLYLKQSGNWQEINYTIYQKVNNEWIESDINKLSENEKAIIKEVIE